jgi:hypothetical protein
MNLKPRDLQRIMSFNIEFSVLNFQLNFGLKAPEVTSCQEEKSKLVVLIETTGVASRRLSWVCARFRTGTDETADP